MSAHVKNALSQKQYILAIINCAAEYRRAGAAEHLLKLRCGSSTAMHNCLSLSHSLVPLFASQHLINIRSAHDKLAVQCLAADEDGCAGDPCDLASNPGKMCTDALAPNTGLYCGCKPGYYADRDNKCQGRVAGSSNDIPATACCLARSWPWPWPWHI